MLMYKTHLLPRLCWPSDTVQSRDDIHKVVRQYTLKLVQFNSSNRV